MNLNSFRIKNYKSIIDSGECILSHNDKILVLAGQNESGKSSVLQALHDYERGELKEYSIRKFDENSAVFPSIECEYVLNDNENFGDSLTNEDKSIISDSAIAYINKSKIFKLIRVFNKEKTSILNIDDNTIKGIEEEIETQRKKAEQEQKDLSVLFVSTKVADVLWRYTPKIIFFDDFCDLLPDKINIDDIVNKNTTAKGYNAVKNIEKILDTDFTDLTKLEPGVQLSRLDKHEKTITANFNERWKQKIFVNNHITIKIHYDSGTRTLNFFILTKEGEYLTLEQRSKGLRWFLSFYFQLTAESKKTDSLVILFDEPGLYLHAKAQKDIKNVFEELSQKDQIIYSTHSPYLIDKDKLYRLKLVVNDEENGTTVEKITTDKIKNKQDALKPIIDAIGFDLAHDFSIVKKKNVIVEGPSDFNYFLAMKTILQLDGDYAFVPSMGVSNIHFMMEFCIGWGLEWLIVMDGDNHSGTEYNKIKKTFFDDDETLVAYKILRLPEHGIEDLFDFQDLKQACDTLVEESDKPLSTVVKEQSNKQLVSQLFLEKINKQKITVSDISMTAQKNFKEVFKFINHRFV